jgi:hypothetical protein
VVSTGCGRQTKSFRTQLDSFRVTNNVSEKGVGSA